MQEQDDIIVLAGGGVDLAMNGMRWHMEEIPGFYGDVFFFRAIFESGGS